MKNSTYNQIVYGSLLHPKELEKHGINMSMVEFVKVHNYKRVFNQEPSRRRADTVNRAVLNVVRDKSSWFNALLIKDISADSLSELDVREIGYDRLNLDEGCVKYYDNDEAVKNCFIYIGKKGKQNCEILPNIEYFKICLNGAKSHFEKFYEDYKSTTYQCHNGSFKLISDI